MSNPRSQKRSNASEKISNHPPSYPTGVRSYNLTTGQLVRIIHLDHSYSLPSAPCEKKTQFFAARFLFQSEEEIAALNEPKSKLENLLTRKTAGKRSQKAKSVEEEEIDVCTVDDDPKVPYDLLKAENLMEECEKNVNFARLNDVPEVWESVIVKTGWTRPQRRVFSKIMKILHADHLARQAYTNNALEPLFRRLSIDKTAQAVRTVLTQFGWDTKLTHWLHGMLVDNLSLKYLAAYLDILQTLKGKIPTLVDRMMALSTTAGGGKSAKECPDKQDGVNSEALNLLLKRQWDPFSTAIHPSKLKKTPVPPVFVVVPSGPVNGSIMCQHRQRSFLSILSGLGKVVTVTLNCQSANKLNISLYCERMLNTTKTKLAEVAESFPEKPIYLIGWGSGGIVAASVSLTENVAGVICLAFPLHGLFGTRADVDDPLHDLKHPTLFVIGDRATNNCVTDMEIFRKGLKCISGLSVICHADSFLRVGNYHQRKLLVTQSYIDKCIIDEISWFLISVPVLEEELKAQVQAQEEQALMFDGPKMIPSNSSSSKRKAYYRPSNSNKESNSPNYITASKLLQQNTSKRKQNLPPSSPSMGLVKPTTISPLAKPTPTVTSISKPPPSSPSALAPSSTPVPVSVVPSRPSVSSPVTSTKLTPTVSSLPKPKPIIPPLPKPIPIVPPLTKPVINLSPRPSKISKDSETNNPFTWPVPIPHPQSAVDSADSKPVPDKPWMTVTPKTSVTPMVSVSSNASSSLNTTASSQSVTTVINQHFISSPSSTPKQSPTKTNFAENLSHSQILKRLMTSTPVTQHQHLPTSTTTMILTTSSGGLMSSPYLGLPKDTTATLSPHPIQMQTSNSEILRRFAAQQQAVHDLQTKQALQEQLSKQMHIQHQHHGHQQQAPQQHHIQLLSPLPLPVSMNQSHQTSLGNKVIEPKIRATFASNLPHQLHNQNPQLQPQIIRLTAVNYPPGSLIGGQQLSAHTHSVMTPTQKERPLPTRCTDDSLSLIDSNEELNPSRKGQINPELFQQLKSTLSVSKDVKMMPKDVKMIFNPRPPRPISTQVIVHVQDHHSGSNPSKFTTATVATAVSKASSVPTVVTTGASLAPRAVYMPKYSVFASKDRRQLKLDTSNKTPLLRPPLTHSQVLVRPSVSTIPISISNVPITSTGLTSIATTTAGDKSGPKLVSVSLASIQKSPSAPSSPCVVATNIKLSPESAAAEIEKALKSGFKPAVKPGSAVPIYSTVTTPVVIPSKKCADQRSSIISTTSIGEFHHKTKSALDISGNNRLYSGQSPLPDKVTVIEITPSTTNVREVNWQADISTSDTSGDDFAFSPNDKDQYNATKRVNPTLVPATVSSPSLATTTFVLIQPAAPSAVSDVKDTNVKTSNDNEVKVKNIIDPSANSSSTHEVDAISSPCSKADIHVEFKVNRNTASNFTNSPVVAKASSIPGSGAPLNSTDDAKVSVNSTVASINANHNNITIDTGLMPEIRMDTVVSSITETESKTNSNVSISSISEVKPKSSSSSGDGVEIIVGSKVINSTNSTFEMKLLEEGSGSTNTSSPTGPTTEIEDTAEVTSNSFGPSLSPRNSEDCSPSIISATTSSPPELAINKFPIAAKTYTVKKTKKVEVKKISNSDKVKPGLQTAMDVDVDVGKDICKIEDTEKNGNSVATTSVSPSMTMSAPPVTPQPPPAPVKLTSMKTRSSVDGNGISDPGTKKDGFKSSEGVTVKVEQKHLSDKAVPGEKKSDNNGLCSKSTDPDNKSISRTTPLNLKSCDTSTSAESVELSSDDEPAARITRSRSRYTPSGGTSSGDVSMMEDNLQEQTMANAITVASLENENPAVTSAVESGSEDNDDNGPRKKNLKPIHPVTPASLSATRTRKITIPKFYAFGM